MSDTCHRSYHRCSGIQKSIRVTGGRIYCWLPLIAFVVVAVLSFTTASFWGMPAIAFPIIIPLAQSCGCNLFLAAAAVVSGAVFGSNACFYGDAAFLVCKTTNIATWEYGKTATFQMLIPFVLACIVYIGYALFFV